MGLGLGLRVRAGVRGRSTHKGGSGRRIEQRNVQLPPQVLRVSHRLLARRGVRRQRRHLGRVGARVRVRARARVRVRVGVRARVRVRIRVGVRVRVHDGRGVTDDASSRGSAPLRSSTWLG